MLFIAPRLQAPVGARFRRRALMSSDLKNAIGDAVARNLENALAKEVRQEPVPRHVAIIMDGNRRFAEEMGLPPMQGHEIGSDTTEDVLDWCLELEVRHVTVYAFSTENFKRSPREFTHLMRIAEKKFLKIADDDRIHKNHVNVRAIGRIDMLPKRVQRAIKHAEERTADYSDYFYTVALAYGGREEILRAIRSLASEVKAGHIQPADIDENLVSKFLYTGHLPDPDLILRTSGEERISNFLLWQLAYSELYFTDVHWPSFRRLDFLRAIRTYQKRKRRYGK